MKSMIKNMAAIAIFSLCSSSIVNAQEDNKKLNFSVQGDLVSSYVWRGMYQTGASFQPTLGLSVAGFSLTAWGSTDFDGNQASEGLANKEIDLTAAYTFGNTGLTLSLADLWWAYQHHFEAGLAYSLPVGKFPLSIAWYTMFAGQDKDADGHQNYSSYVELNYPFSVKKVDLTATCGIVPYKAPQYNTNGFAVTNIALKGTAYIRITDSFSLPIFAQAIWNPRMEDAHLVLGITLRP